MSSGSARAARSRSTFPSLPELFLAFLFVVFLPQSASAEERVGDHGSESSSGDRERARQLYLRGSAYADAGSWDQAFESYRQAFRLYPAPSSLYNMGYCQSRRGELLEAWRMISEALVLSSEGSGPPLSAERIQVAETERDSLRQRLATLVVNESGEFAFIGARPHPVPYEPATYRLEMSSPNWTGAMVEATEGAGEWFTIAASSRILVNPGTYRIHQRHGEQVSLVELELQEGSTVTLPASPRVPPPQTGGSLGASADRRSGMNTKEQLSPPISHAREPVRSSEPRPYRTVGIAGLAVGGTSLAVALISTAIALGADSQLSAGCDSNGACPETLGDVVSRYETAATIANVTFITAIASSVGGAGALIFDHELRRSRVAVTAGPASFRIHVSF